MIDVDMVGRLAIRLGRSYSQGWAKAIPKDARWNWETASAYAQAAKTNRPPHVEGNSISFSHSQSGTQWIVSPNVVRVDFFDRAGERQGSVEAKGADVFGPSVHVEMASFAGMQEAAIWRFDRALTSVCEGPWKALHALTPIICIAKALPEYLPTEHASLTYCDGRIKSSFAPLDDAMRRAGVRFFTQWERMITR